jgi:uncharacterized protein
MNDPSSQPDPTAPADRSPPPDGSALPDPSAKAGREVARRLRTGAFLTAGAVGLLALGTDLSFWDVVALPLFYVLLPALALAQVPLLATEKIERLPVYLGSMVAILILGWLSLALGLRLDQGIVRMGLVLLPLGELVLWTAGATGAGLILVALFHPLDRRVPGHHHRVLSELLPRTGPEKAAFVGLSAAAGTGEELAYRGYALVGIQLLGVGPWGAAVASSAAFGFLHAYQGPVGIVRTGILGMILAVPVLVTGSIVPSMLAHALLDVVLGLVLGRWLIVEGEGSEKRLVGALELQDGVPEGEGTGPDLPA